MELDQNQDREYAFDLREVSGPVLQSVADFRKSIALVEREYHRVQHLKEEGSPSHPLERHPSAVTLAARSPEGEVVVRGTLVPMGKPEWSASLPCSDQPEFDEIVQNTRGLKGEVTRLASAPENRGSRMIRSLMDDVAMMGLSLGIHSLFLVCHPDHQDFYISCFEADPVLTVDSYAGVKDKPGTLMKITVEDFYHFTRWTPQVLSDRVAGPIGEEVERMRRLYEGRIQLQGLPEDLLRSELVK